jgi:hypothetical protein
MRVVHSKRKSWLWHVQELGRNTGLDLLVMSLVRSGVSQAQSSFEGNEKEPLGICSSPYFCPLGILTNGSLQLSFEGGKRRRTLLIGKLLHLCLPEIIFQLATFILL